MLRAVTIVLLALGTSGPAAAGDPAAGSPAWARSFDAIRAAAAAVHTVSARFTQEKHLKILAKPLVSEGRFAFRAPDSIRWEYQRPIRSVLLMNRGKLARYAMRDGAWVPDAAERVETMRVVVGEIQGWLTGRFERSEAFSAELVSGPEPKVVLRPKDPAMAEFIQRIELSLARQPGELAAVEIIEGPSARTVLRFEDRRINAELPPGTFEPPK